ncbi:hypothetical protein KD33_07115 [Clostridium sp. NCR]|nr:hypothetical protein KD33_07115 [Clostridium sp. NCR]
MQLKKIFIISCIALILFFNSTKISSSIETQNQPLYSNIIKDLSYIDNNMYILIGTISKNRFNKNDAIKQINFLESLIRNLSRKSSVVLSDEDSVIIAIKAILSFYELSLVDVKNYINTNNVNNFIDAISNFTTVYNSSIGARKIINKAGT